MIRPTTPDDAPSLIALAQATDMFKPLEIEALGEVLDDYFDGNRDAGHLCVTAERDGVLIGFAYYAPAAMTEQSWHLWWIAVAKNLQGTGVGRALLQYFEDDVRAHDGERIFIETGSLPHYEPTRQFYLKNGYEQHAVLKDFYGKGDSMIVFRRQL